MGFYFHKHLPGDALHTATGNQWLKQAHEARTRMAKRLGMTPLQYSKAVITMFDGSRNVSKELRAHLVAFAKKYPLGG